ncbi:DEAD/DEAH box helicase family protein [Nocardia cyriacigeorgica]|uniref:DEAD/DEAH box helicase n=1 Tax=Nocardia cyriacigeorgica TaxID=135487 RepID=UPI0018943CE8|nr:DEAD/DEAH box helicase family protein [Nocardia cyriacigeorgica]MBF6427827.1 DEAD/DEAH box helicase family protein [Nocardia cyriacigeorgica]
MPVEGNELWWLREGAGAHGEQPTPPESVVARLQGCFAFVDESTSGKGLRAPQLGALHAVLAYRSTENYEPIVVVMPTGAGKTETMLAVFCHSPVTTMVVVPSDALRTQIATKFTTLGILPTVGAVSGEFLCPAVLVLSHAIHTVAQASQLLARTNVIVATAQVLNACSAEARTALAHGCARLFLDEAHHTAAQTWRAVAELFAGREVVQFTATPYREDGRHIGGRIAYSYPLRLAQKNGFFARINYHSVVDLSDPDRAVAVAAVAQLRTDIAAGLDHLLMARVSSVARAKTVIKLYEEIAPDLAPVRIDTGMAASTRHKRQALLGSSSRIVVCVNMLGEGFDMPRLKVAAIHDPQQSLAVTLQFIGRFTRSGNAELGEASAFVPLQIAGIDERLRTLYGEDADWNEVLCDLTEHNVGLQRERSEFELAFGSLPREVALRSIHPKMSTVIYRASASTPLEWAPDRIYDLFEGRLLTTKLGINHRDKIVWWVSREASAVRWGEFASFNELVHHLHVVHVDTEGGFLYINSTNNSSMHDDIAAAVGGPSAELIRGETVYRVLAKVNRRVPTNVGLLDSVSRNRRFSMYAGQNVLYAWKGEGATKMKTNIFAYGFSAGRAVSFGASRKGRVWSHEQADDLHHWMKWVRQVGPAITDESVSLESVMSGFLLPEPATSRPPYVPLAVEWPHRILATLSERRKLAYGGEQYTVLDTEFRLTSHTTDGPLRFEVVTPSWKLEFEFVFDADFPPTIRPVAEDGELVTAAATISLAQFLTDTGLLVSFTDDVVLLEAGLLLRPEREKHLFPVDSIEVFDWTGIDLRRESRKSDDDTTAIAHRVVEVISAETEWEVVIDDDGSGELADLVFMRRIDNQLEVLLVHCKYSSAPTPGKRIDDLYDVCGQAMKMNRAKSMPELLTRRLLQRERNRQAGGRTGIIHGDLAKLVEIVQQARFRELRVEVAIVQPGMSRVKASTEMRALLGAVQRFLVETYAMPLRVIGSA